MTHTIKTEHSSDNKTFPRGGKPALEIKIRPEQNADRMAVECLTREAFWNLYRPGCDEHYTAHLIHEHEDFLPDLTCVAEVDGQIVGTLGVIGPTRMPYQRMIEIVDITSRMIGNALSVR